MLCGAVVLAAVYFLMMNYLFVVRRVSVQLPQNSRFTAQQAAASTGIVVGTRLDRVDRAAVAQALQDTGWLILEDMELKYPDQVHLVVSERKPAAMVSHVSTLLVTDSDGVLIEQVSGDPGYADCLYVTDVDIRRAQPGQPLQSGTSGKIEGMVALLKGLEQVPCHDLIAWASLESPRNIRLYSSNHVWVSMGDEEKMTDKLRLAEAALSDMISKDEKLGKLNVSSGLYADYAPED